MSGFVKQAGTAHKDNLSHGHQKQCNPSNILVYENLKMLIDTFNPASMPMHAFVTLATCHGCFLLFFIHWSTLLRSINFPPLSLMWGTIRKTNIKY